MGPLITVTHEINYARYALSITIQVLLTDAEIYRMRMERNSIQQLTMR